MIDVWCIIGGHMERKQEYSDGFLNDSNNTYIGIGEVALGYPGDFLKISSLGSCIGLVIYPEINEISNRCAVMGHIMLPKGRGREKRNIDTKIGKVAKFADEAIPTMVEVLEGKKHYRKQFVAKMAGGAKMFGHVSKTLDIGKENSSAIKSILKLMNIPLVKHYTGGETGMKVIFDVSKYELSVTPTGGNSIIL